MEEVLAEMGVGGVFMKLSSKLAKHRKRSEEL